MLEPLYKTKAHCPYCEVDFETSRIRPSFKKAASTDTDFHVVYKQINPDHYVVAVCPTCGFSFTENFSKGLTPAQRNEFERIIKNNWSVRDYGGERDWEETLQTYKLALLCAQVKDEKDRIMAGLLHHIAWLYREKGDAEQERRFLEFALQAYIGVYELEGVSVDNARLMYLLGELSRRTGRYGDAVKWFARIINDKNIVDSAMIRQSREQWAVTREDMLAAKMELPEEMKQGG